MNIQPHLHDQTDQPWLEYPFGRGSALCFGHAPPAAPPRQDQPDTGRLRHAPGILTLGLQPRHGLFDGALCAAEASLCSAPPDAASRDPDLALRLGAWLLETACHEAREWNTPRLQPAVAMCVDLPECLLRKDTLPAQTKQALAQSGLQPGLLELALPAQALTSGDTGILRSLATLRDLGVGLGLDRFGTLAASPRALQRLPLTFVKLDPVLTRDITESHETRRTVKAACALAHALGASVLATEVQNVTQRDILADLGCDTAQGRVFGGTLRPDAFHASLLPSLV